MGRFLTIEDITGKNYTYSRGKYDWIVGNLDQNFPYLLSWYEDDSIDWDRKTSEVPRVKVRRWCERNLEGDVYAVQKNDSKFKYRNPKKHFDGGYQISASWTEFRFEFETDAMAFKIMWLDNVDTV